MHYDGVPCRDVAAVREATCVLNITEVVVMRSGDNTGSSTAGKADSALSSKVMTAWHS